MKLPLVHLVLGIAQAALGTVTFFASSACVSFVLVPTIGGIFSGILVILSGVFGILSYMRQIRGYLVVCLVLCILACVKSVESIILSGSLLSRYSYYKNQSRQACMATLLGLSVTEVCLAIVQSLLLCFTA